MVKIFLYNNANGQLELNTPEILLVTEFKELMDNKRNITKEDPTGKYATRAWREFTYIYLAQDWQSPYYEYLEQERHQLALQDSKLTTEEFDDPKFRAMCRKYKELQNETRSIKLLKAALETIDKFIDYFHNVDPEERDENTGKPIFKVKDIMSEISSLSTVHKELQQLESMVKKELVELTSLRGGYEDGYMPNF